jgi:Ca-activated chloride channel homolog
VGTTSTRKHLRLALTFLLICGASARVAPSDSEPTTFRTSVTEVRLTFSATDENNRGVVTLQEGDCAVVDKDVIVRSFRSFNRVEMTALDVAILIDESPSISPRFRQEIANAVQLISRADAVPDESFSVASFRGQNPTLICDGNCRASQTGDHFRAEPAGGLTPLFDGIVFASNLLARRSESPAKKALILFSDGEDTISRHSSLDAMRAAMMGSVQIYTVDLGTASDPQQGGSILQNLAYATGGQSFTVQQGSEKVIAAVLEDFHATYAVTYKMPSASNGLHEVRILPTHNRNLTFRCRSGYFYPDRTR